MVDITTMLSIRPLAILVRFFQILVIVGLVAFSSLSYITPAVAVPATFTVNVASDASDANPGDDICETATPGECSLRAAIEEANANGNAADVDLIDFAIAGTGPHEILLTDYFPQISEPLSIDGTSQTGTDCVTKQLQIQVNGDSQYGSLDFALGADDSSVRGLSLVNNVFVGLTVNDITGFTISCSLLGVEADGTTPNGNGENGARFTNTNNVVIGGNNPGDGIVASHNLNEGISAVGPGSNYQILNNIANDQVTFRGILLQGISDITISGNEIVSNNDRGLVLSDGSNATITNNIVGGSSDSGISFFTFDTATLSGNRTEDNGANGIISEESSTNLTITNNVVVGNGATGINISDSSNNTIQGNYVGVENDGLTPNGNGSAGIVIVSSSTDNASNNLIGGTLPSERNYVANSAQAQIALAGFEPSLSTSGNRVIGNYVGVDINGEVNENFTNNFVGVGLVGRAFNNVIGGTSDAEKNIIGGNTAGLTAMAVGPFVPIGNSFLGNSVFANQGGMGIDLFDDTDFNFVPEVEVGVTSNDSDDSDTGPNDYINYPVVSNVATVGDDVAITYSVDVNDSEVDVTGYRIEFYANVSSNPSGHGDGQIYLGSEDISGDVTDRVFTIPNTGLPVGTYSFALTTTQINPTLPFGFGSTSEYSGVQVAGITASNTTTDPGSNSSSGGSSSGTGSNSAQGTLAATGAQETNSQNLYALLLITVGFAFVIISKVRLRAATHPL